MGAASLFILLQLQAAPIYLSRPMFNPAVCAKKRVDACGCHHLYGIRHCHPNRKTPHCESPASGRPGELFSPPPSGERTLIREIPQKVGEPSAAKT